MGRNKKRRRCEKGDAATTTVKEADEVPTMVVKSGTKVENVMRFARKILETGERRKIVWTGCGDAIVRTISCAEILRREFRVHQVTEISQEASGKTSHIPHIRILQSLDAIDPSTCGYQNPEGASQFCRDTAPEIPTTHRQITKRRKLEGSKGDVEQ